MAKPVVIFRHQLFKISEPFITQQAEALVHFHPIYVGRNLVGPPPIASGARALTLSSRQRTRRALLWHVVTRDPRPLRRLLNGLSPSLIHAHFGVEGVYALPLARSLGVPLVTTLHGFDVTVTRRALYTSGSVSWANYGLFRRELASEGNLFICVSEFIRRQALAAGFPAERTVVHYIGIDAHAITPGTHGEESPVILHVARLVEKKGTEYLLQAFARIHRDHPSAVLVVVGDGPRRKMLEALARELGLGARVRFTGALAHADVMALMKTAAAFVLPSVQASTGDAEGLGMVLLEAAATGLPVIGTVNGGIPEAIDDETTGYVVPEKNIIELADRIDRLLRDPSLRQWMGQRGREMVAERFDLGRQTAELERMYRAVLADN